MSIFNLKKNKTSKSVASEKVTEKPTSENKAGGIYNFSKIILKKPLISEKMTMVSKYRQHGFIVPRDVNKSVVRDYIEKKYKVDVMKINMMKYEGKTKRLGRSIGKRSDFKKAIVTLKKDQKITIA